MASQLSGARMETKPEISNPLVETREKRRDDKSMDVTLGGKTYNLTLEEYNAYRGSEGNVAFTQGKTKTLTPKVKELIELRNKALGEYQTRKDVIVGTEKQDVINKIIEEEIAKGEEIPELPTIEELRAKEAEQSQRDILGLTKEETSAITPQTLLSPTLKSQFQSLKIVGNVAAQGLDVAARLVSPIFQGGKLRKSSQVIKAEDTINTNLKLIDNDIAAVKEGASITDALRNLNEVVAAINRMDRAVQLENILNPSSWLDGGAEIKATLAYSISELEQKRRDLIAAAQTAQITAAKGRLGL